MLEIVSKGRVVQLSVSEIDELRTKCGPYGWYRYCQLRLTMSHSAVLDAMSGARCSAVFKKS